MLSRSGLAPEDISRATCHTVFERPWLEYSKVPWNLISIDDN